MNKNKQLRILTLDIENFPCLVYTWGLGEQHIPLEFLVRDYSICAWAAKWLGEDKVMYMDNRSQKNIYDDKRIVEGVIKLINEADIIIGQNVKSFDLRKIRARAEFNGLRPFKTSKVTDILTEERRVFGLTSHKLAFKTQRNKKYKKLKHEKYPGFELWQECMAKNMDAWKHMETYCKYDVLATEERYLAVQGWIRSPNMGPLDGVMRCRCGSIKLRKKGFAYTETAKYQVYLCLDCGKWPRDSINLLTKDIKTGIMREVA